jgi:hypothetical protein
VLFSIGLGFASLVVLSILTWPLIYFFGLAGLGLWYWRRQKANDAPADLSIWCGPFTSLPPTPIEITRAELDLADVQPYGGCTIGKDRW